MHCLSVLDAVLFYCVIVPIVSLLLTGARIVLEYATRVNELLAFLRDV
jgi:hypothetical protein